jgi:hypothetical protein
VSNPLQIQHIATRLIALHGPEARTYAANKADEMLAAGKLYERRTWRRVQEEVERALGRDLLGDFPGLAAGLYADTAQPPSMPAPFAKENGRASDPPSSDPHTAILALSTKWMSS